MPRHGKPRFTPRTPSRTPDRRERPKPAAPPSHGFRPFETFEATFLGHPEGPGGFLRPVGAAGRGSDIFVDWRDKHSAIHGDRVQAEVTGEDSQGRPRARVLQVLNRGELPIPATLKREVHYGPKAWRAIPIDPRLGQVIAVPPTDLAEDGDLVSVKLDPDPEATQLRGEVLAKLGRPTDLRIENKLTAALFNLRTEFPAAVLKELAPFPTEIPEAWAAGREDLRTALTCTVDPPTAKDFDDAISLEALPGSEGGGWLLGVHIADVSHYVAEDGPLDQEARVRGTSVYFPDEAIPMIPERLSGDLCSLREAVDRLTLSAWITLSPALEVVETRFTESVIRSRKRLTYDEVKEACLDAKPAKRAELGPDLCAMLDEALAVSRSLTEKRLGRGAMNLDTEETQFLFDAEGRPVDAKPYERHDAHRMIEEFMLLANEAVARFFTRRKIPTLYRIHDEPDPLKLEVFADTAREFGLLGPKETPTPEHLNAMLDKIRGGPLEVMINTMLLRSLKKAEYSADNIGHSGLALDDYLHFTSPIRRYPDLVVHRNLRKVLRGEKLPDGLHAQLALIAKQASDAEQKATEAERENKKWKACLLMKERVGQRFQGVIQGFSPKVVFIQLLRPFIEVGVPLAALGGDFFVDERRTHISGLRGQVKLGIGATCEVEITGVDEDLRRVSAWLIEAKAADAKGKPFAFTPSLAAPARLAKSDFEAPKRGRYEGAIGGQRGGDRERRPHGRSQGRPPKPAREGKPKAPKGSVRGSGGPAKPARAGKAHGPKRKGR
ncbi:MAG TPA: VacB/RNase II family 3'-5' exoribonuclease [Holophagaceae bacterium]|nr:VacB/RNase II family 3'-5' exoribonuclease [Holophagaceae bacterium]